MKLLSVFSSAFVFLRDPLRKSLWRVTRDIAVLLLAERRFPGYYFTRLAYQNVACDIRGYLSTRDVQVTRAFFGTNQDSTAAFFSNKLIFESFMRAHDCPLPDTLAATFGRAACFGGAVFPITDCASLMRVLESIGLPLFIKPLDGQNGRVCMMVRKNTKADELAPVLERMDQISFLIQRPIQQHSNLSHVYPHSVNTLRIDTYQDQDGQVEVISALVRFGMRHRVVDNGGCFCGVRSDGCLSDLALCFLENGAATYSCHPDTNVAFGGLQIPFFSDAINLVKKAAKLAPMRLVGWDVAISPNGPILIEGNHNYHLGMSDMAYGGYRRNPVFRRVLAEARREA